jgi:hypothetical protein
VFSKIGFHSRFGPRKHQSQSLSLLVEATIKFLPETIETDFCSNPFGSCAVQILLVRVLFSR